MKKLRDLEKKTQGFSKKLKDLAKKTQGFAKKLNASESSDSVWLQKIAQKKAWGMPSQVNRRDLMWSSTIFQGFFKSQMGVNRFLAFKVSHFSTVCLCGSEFPTRGYESTKFARGGLVYCMGGLQIRCKGSPGMRGTQVWGLPRYEGSQGMRGPQVRGVPRHEGSPGIRGPQVWGVPR